MLNIYSADYSSMNAELSNDIFTLRKKIFKDRLNWAVNCLNGMEYDQFDNSNTNYIYGVEDGKIICGTRIIKMNHKNMLMETFSCFFKKINIPKGNYIESTRFFVDKQRSRVLLGQQYPVTNVLFLAIINFARQHGYEGIIAVASKPMLHIIKNSGWNTTLIETGYSETKESVYLILGHVDEESQKALKKKILEQECKLNDNMLNSWPLSKNTLS